MSNDFIVQVARKAKGREMNKMIEKCRRIFNSKTEITIFVTLFIFSGYGCQKQSGARADKELLVDVSVNKMRAKPGETVAVKAEVKADKISRPCEVKADLFVPTKGTQDLDLQIADKDKRIYQGNVDIPQDAAKGLYGITVTVKSGSSKAVGKASFLVGKVIGDFVIASAFPKENVEEDIARCFQDFLGLGGNMLIIHDIISEKAWYPSKICHNAAAAGSSEDRVGLALKLTDELGLPSLISVVWDMTRKMPYSERPESTKSVLRELWQLYGHHPSLVGFYSYQEGSGTYLVSQLREFCDEVKAQNRGLLTGCAPYIDDPLLAGYLAAIDSLDIVIYQGAVMASFRPDNRKCFPLRRTKDFTSLSAGATLIRNKITLSHVEFFGYLEKSYANSYLASYDDIRGQILSAATSYGPDGITFFTYHYNIHHLSKKIPEAQESGLGVKRGLDAYKLIAESVVREPSPIALYIPYSDWWVERWTNAFIPALDSLRLLGFAADIVPYVPPKGEEILPYYPMSLNEEELEYFLERKLVLVLPDISGMQDTDSILLKTFVEKGGVALLFGPRIPYGDRFEREVLCGGKEKPIGKHSWLEVKERIYNRVNPGTKFVFQPSVFSSWIPTTATAAASFEDGSAAALVNRFGKGTVFTVPMSTKDAIRIAPDLVRDILDFALAEVGVKRTFDILGASEDIDLAMSSADGVARLAVVNYKNDPVKIKVCPLNLAPDAAYDLTDLRTGKIIVTEPGRDLRMMEMKIEKNDFIALSLTLRTKTGRSSKK